MNIGQYLWAMAMLAGLLAALTGGAVLARRSKVFEGLRTALQRPGPSLKLVSSIALDQRTRLVVVEDGEREHLLLIGSGLHLETRPRTVSEPK